MDLTRLGGVGDYERAAPRGRLFTRGGWAVFARALWIRATQVAVVALDHTVLDDEQKLG